MSALINLNYFHQKGGGVKSNELIFPAKNNLLISVYQLSRRITL
jgi:hypothetical protein